MGILEENRIDCDPYLSWYVISCLFFVNTIKFGPYNLW